MMQITKNYLKNLIYQVNGAAIEVHKQLGPGLLESVYQRCLMHELKQRRIDFISELIIPVEYKGLQLDVNLRCDLFIEEILPVELKAVEYILPVHVAQLMTYMKLLKVPEGLLINFNVSNLFIDGQHTYVNELYRILPE